MPCYVLWLGVAFVLEWFLIVMKTYVRLSHEKREKKIKNFQSKRWVLFRKLDTKGIFICPAVIKCCKRSKKKPCYCNRESLTHSLIDTHNRGWIPPSLFFFCIFYSSKVHICEWLSTKWVKNSGNRAFSIRKLWECSSINQLTLLCPFFFKSCSYL